MLSTLECVVGDSVQPLLCLARADVDEGPNTAVGVVGDNVVHWDAWVVVENVDQFRIMCGPWGALIVDGL